MGFFLMLLQMIPAIIGIVKQVENVIPGKGKGSAKLDMVLKTVDVAAKSSPQIITSVGNHDLKGAVTGIVNTVVETMNATGAFIPPTAEPTPQP